MLRILLILVFLISSLSVFAFESEFKGFIALDVLNAIKEESENQELTTGIGTFDLKFYARQEDFTMKIKLDLDDSDLGTANKIFEEALASYIYSKNLRFIGGKGKVPFHQMHWGVIGANFVDGGSLLGSNHSLRDQDNKLVLGARYGNRKMGFINHFTLFGESEVPKYDNDGNLEISNGSIQTRATKTFSAKEQRGLANKLELYPSRELKLSAAVLYFYADYRPKETYAFDVAGNYTNKEVSYWWEYTYAKISKNAYDAYATLDQDEHLAQIGFEKTCTDFVNFLMDFQYSYVDSLRHNADLFADDSSSNDGNVRETTTIKGSAGLKFKISKSAFLTYGVELEKQEYTKIDPSSGDILEDANTHAYATGLDLSYWF